MMPVGHRGRPRCPRAAGPPRCGPDSPVSWAGSLNEQLTCLGRGPLAALTAPGATAADVLSRERAGAAAEGRS